MARVWCDDMSRRGNDRVAPVVVAIDGPGGAGKSTLARALAERLAVPHVDTGAIYRAATLAVLRAGVSPTDALGCELVAARAHITRIGGRTLLGGEDVEDEIRGPAVTAAVSEVSAHPGVRTLLLDRQRAGLGEHGGVVEGRDAGTAVVPDADVKVWLTADADERAARRAAQLGETAPHVVGALAEDLARRDASDAERMRPAPDAYVIDTSDQEVADLVDRLCALIATTRAGSRR